MWNNLFGSAGSVVAEKAKNSITATLEVAGDAITNLATSHVAKQREKEKNVAAGKEGTARQEQDQDTEQSSDNKKETNTDVLLSSWTKKHEDENTVTAANDDNNETNPSHPQHNRFPSFMTLEMGKQFFESTRHVIQHQTQQIASAAASAAAARSWTASAVKVCDPALPLDTEALRDAEVVYITDRLITMGHPAMQSLTDGDITPNRKLTALGHLLQKRHAGKFMVWNLSEVEYDYSILDDQVLAYNFPGSPSPPLGLLLKLIFSIESWLKADALNIAVLHCLTGKGRTSTVLACFLCWTGEAGFQEPMSALKYIALCKRCDVDQLTIPSQRRYVGYFSNMLDGVRPHQPPLVLKRIIMSEAPKV